MEAALWYHTDVVSTLLRRRAGTAHDVDWQSYEGKMTCWLLKYVKTHPGWTKNLTRTKSGGQTSVSPTVGLT